MVQPLFFRSGLQWPGDLYPDWSIYTAQHHPSSWSYPELGTLNPNMPMNTQRDRWRERERTKKHWNTLNKKDHTSPIILLMSCIFIHLSLHVMVFTLLIFPVVKLQTPMNPSTDPVIKYFPSGEKRAHSTCDRRPNCRLKWRTNCSLALLHPPEHTLFCMVYGPVIQRCWDIKHKVNIGWPKGGIKFSTRRLFTVV